MKLSPLQTGVKHTHTIQLEDLIITKYLWKLLHGKIYFYVTANVCNPVSYRMPKQSVNV